MKANFKLEIYALKNGATKENYTNADIMESYICSFTDEIPDGYPELGFEFDFFPNWSIDGFYVSDCKLVKNQNKWEMGIYLDSVFVDIEGLSLVGDLINIGWSTKQLKV